jgi:hypothetical protein
LVSSNDYYLIAGQQTTNSMSYSSEDGNASESGNSSQDELDFDFGDSDLSQWAYSDADRSDSANNWFEFSIQQYVATMAIAHGGH